MSKWSNAKAEDLYEVFGRAAPDEPLAHIGTIPASSGNLAKARARMMHAEKDWIELSVVPASAFLNLIGQKEDYTVGFA